MSVTQKTEQRAQWRHLCQNLYNPEDKYVSWSDLTDQERNEYRFWARREIEREQR